MLRSITTLHHTIYLFIKIFSFEKKKKKKKTPFTPLDTSHQMKTIHNKFTGPVN